MATTFNNHPLYQGLYEDWCKWRLTYLGGPEFRDRYLEKFTDRESDEDFKRRRCMTYTPAFAAAAVDEVKNSIYERLTDITRVGGSKAYMQACNGEDGGVDQNDATMMNFMGVKVLPELLTMKRVGIYVDMPEKRGETKADNIGLKPYLYIYQTEQIQNWVKNNHNQYESVQLEDQDFSINPDTGYPDHCITRKRNLWRDQYGVVHVELWQDGKMIDEKFLSLSQIPLVMLELPHSLLQNIADYQIALLNLESSDLISILKSNFPFYVEQGDKKGEVSNFIRQGTPDDPAAKSAPAIHVGAYTGRKYYGDNAPEFIHPSPEPLEVSMAKQEQMKADIKHLLSLSVANLAPSKVSAASKELDSQGLESGLAFIGQILEKAETKIAKIWAEYEDSQTPAKIKYPDSYSLKSVKTRLEECDSLLKTSPKVASNKFRRQISKMVAATLLNGKVQQAVLEEINKEIDKNAPVNFDDVILDVEAGLVSNGYASSLKGYPAGEAEKAADEKAKRAEELMKAQAAANPKPVMNAGARGLNDLSVDPKQEAKDEKALSQKPENTGDTKKRVRGRGKNNVRQ